MASVLVPAAMAAALVAGYEHFGDETRPRAPSAPELARLVERAPAISPLWHEPPPTAVIAPPTTGPATAPVVGGGPRPHPPASISIPSAAVSDAPIDALPVTGGALPLPPVHRTGWHMAGPRPGEPGRAVIIGHRDSPDGPAVFSAVPTLVTGAEIEVTDQDGAVHRYTVTRRARAPKERFPTEAVFGPTEASELVLVTCSGDFVDGQGYADNMLVFARAA